MSKLVKNTSSSLINQVVTVFCGFILPRFILTYYGTEVNGLVSSITQYLGFISLMDLGVGAVVQSAYYRPLYEKDNKTISLIFYSSKRFFRLVGQILVGYSVVLCFVYTNFVNTSYDKLFVVSLIAIISISSFVQYYFAIPNQILLNADQRLYVQSNIQIFTLVLNTIVSICLIYLEYSIQIVKLTSVIVFLIKPFILYFYVKKYYSIDVTLAHQKYKIDQQWNGIAQHAATVVMNNTDVMVLTFCSSLQDVSIYTIYYMVVNGLKVIINSFANSYTPLLGEIYASGDNEKLNMAFTKFEWLIHMLSCLLFGVAMMLIIPFVKVYTSGINDANYIQPVFAILLLIGQIIYCIRIPYNSMICAASCYRQTQYSAIIEMLLNIIISIVFVLRYGLVGVAIGTFVAITYRTVYFIYYLKKNVLYLKIGRTSKLCVIDVIQIIVIILLDKGVCSIIPFSDTIYMWTVHAISLLGISTLTLFVLQIFIYKEYALSLIRLVWK